MFTGIYSKRLLKNKVLPFLLIVIILFLPSCAKTASEVPSEVSAVYSNRDGVIRVSDGLTVKDFVSSLSSIKTSVFNSSDKQMSDDERISTCCYALFDASATKYYIAVMGDVNCDSYVTEDDVSAAEKIIGKDNSVNTAIKEAADVGLSGSVRVNDIDIIKNSIGDDAIHLRQEWLKSGVRASEENSLKQEYLYSHISIALYKNKASEKCYSAEYYGELVSDVSFLTELKDEDYLYGYVELKEPNRENAVQLIADLEKLSAVAWAEFDSIGNSC